MKYSQYPVTVEEAHTKYEFISEGRNGSIRKTVVYAQIRSGIFNLSFGDWNAEIDKMDDSITSNNGDRDKVLATVATTAIEFTNNYPGALIYTEGSTPARTRLYQMAIAKNLEEISENFEIEGYIDRRWELFQKGRNYEAFLVKRK